MPLATGIGQLVLAALLLAGCAADAELQRLGLMEPAEQAASNSDRADGAMGVTALPSATVQRASRTRPAARTASAQAPTGPGSGQAAERSSVSSLAESASIALADLRRKIDEAFTPDKPPRAERQRLGDALARKVLKDARTLRNGALVNRLRRIVQRLAPAARAESDFPARWQVHVIDSDRADAFTSGGGHLFITRGMTELLQSDERIATVLAHEMAHNLLAHVWDAREKKEAARKAQRFSKEVLAQKMRLPWLGRSVAFLVRTSLNTYSRQQEYDADALGLHLLVQAGWKPQVALETFDYLRRHFREESGIQNFFYSHHPLYERRRWYLANRIRAYYRKQAGLPPVRRANWK